MGCAIVASKPPVDATSITSRVLDSGAAALFYSKHPPLDPALYCHYKGSPARDRQSALARALSGQHRPLADHLLMVHTCQHSQQQAVPLV